MGTNLHLQPTEGKLITRLTAPNPVREARVTSETKDSKFSSSFVDLHYAYGGGTPGKISVSFDDIDLVVDALLEHQAARQGRLEEAVTIGEAETLRQKYRKRFMERAANPTKEQA